MRTVCAAITLLLVVLTTSLFSQNVGIGEANPTATLEVKGDVTLPTKPFLVKDGFDVPLLSVTSLARIGFNTADPQVPFHLLTFGLEEAMRIEAPNPFITLFGSGGVPKAFMGVNLTFDIGTAVGSNIPVTIAPNGNLSTQFAPNGYVGIGVEPLFVLDINGRMRIRHQSQSAGIWFNNSLNTATPAFVGMQSDSQVGLYGNVAGWGLLMNTTNGNVGINSAATSAKLEVQGDGTGSTALKVGSGKIVYSGAGVNTATPVFVHKATSANTPSSLGYTVIDNPYCNSDPSAILIVTMNGTYGSGNGDGYTTVAERSNPMVGPQIISPTSVLVFFNGSGSNFYAASPAYAKDKWCIRTYSGNFVSDPLDLNFNVMIVHPN